MSAKTEPCDGISIDDSIYHCVGCLRSQKILDAYRTLQRDTLVMRRAMLLDSLRKCEAELREAEGQVSN